MATELLERESQLRELEAALKETLAGEGRVALVGGEAGIGKSSLIEHFVRRQRSDVRLLWGGCDALFTPRPLGPLFDMAAQLGGSWLSFLNSEVNRNTLYSTFLNNLQSSPVIAVFEDVHWADEATFDLLKYIGRRSARTQALLVITYRDDEIGPQHPLRIVLGDLLTSTAVRHIRLAPLSETAVFTLIGDRTLDPTALHRQTGGNPFFVTEAIASGADGIPPTIRDAILARAARLSASGRAVLEAAAVIGPRIEPWLLTEVTRAEAYATEDCIAAGMLVVQGDILTFRHEIGWQTILEAISPPQKLVLHRLVLEALKPSPLIRADPARLAYHARALDDREGVLEYAPAAARRSASVGAHREAATLYALALRFADDLPPASRALLLEAYAWECNIIDQRVEGIAARRQAVELWQLQGDSFKQGQNLVQLAVMLVLSGKDVEAERASHKAIELLRALPPGRELALAYRSQAMVRMLNQDISQAIDWGEKAIALAERFEDEEVIALAHNTVGTAWLFSNYEHGCAYLERAFIKARSAGRNLYAVNALSNLGTGSAELFQLKRAERYLSEGITFSRECDFDAAHFYMHSWQALTFLYLGRWEDAAEAAATVLQHPGVSATSRIMALVALGRLRARRGDPGSAEALDEALKLAQHTRQLQPLGPIYSARAEAAWLVGNHEQVVVEAQAVYDLAVSKRHPWLTGELGFWRWRVGDEISLPAWVSQPFALQMRGSWRGAAEAWGQLGCPYERAMALMDGSEAAQLEAVDIFKQLGAWPAASLVQQKLHAVPQRQREKEKFGGLTEREREVALLIAQGKSNREIAETMTVGVKTIETYVTRILNKLNFESRVQIAIWVVERGFLPPADALSG